MNTITMPTNLVDIYEAKLADARADFETKSRIKNFFAPDIDPTLLELFFIYFNALGVNMTEPVESWISRAGTRCEELGKTEIGRALKLHAKHEANHHLMMIKDTKFLVDQWNRNHSLLLDVDQLLAHSKTPGINQYSQLHEDVIASNTPFGQLAIEYEIEMLSVRYGPQLINQCIQVLGLSFVQGLTFLQDHVEIDVAHTTFNRNQLEQFVKQYPECVSDLVNAGTQALDAYATFINDCFELAQSKLSGAK
jgi:hypothetical protein